MRPSAFLGDVLIIDLDVAFDGIGQVLGGVEAGGGQNVGDAPVEAFDHAVGLGSSRFGEPVLDAVVGTDPIEGMDTGRLALAGDTEAISKFLAVVGEHPADRERSFINQARKKVARGGCRLVLKDLHVNPSASPDQWQRTGSGVAPGPASTPQSPAHPP